MDKRKNKKLLSVMFALLVAFTSITQPVFATDTSSDPVTTEVTEIEATPTPETTPTPTPEVTVEPTQTPEVVVPENTETPAPEVTPTPTTTPEATPEVTPEATQTPEVSEEFEKASLSDVVTRVMLGENMVILSGLDEDEHYKATKDAYLEIYKGFEDEAKIHYVELDKNSIDDIDALASLSINDIDKELVVANLNSLKDGKIGSGLIMKSLNSHIYKVDAIMELTEDDELTYDQVVRQHMAMTYNNLINQPNRKIALFAAPSENEGEIWDLVASEEKIQSFTAPYAGIYHIDLWGADGDSDSGANAVNANAGKYTSGIGGQAGHTSGDIYLDEGQTIYLGLGFRNEMRSRPGYNGGGAGYPRHTGFRSGGGDAGAIYKTERGMGRLIDYENYKDEILMVAGGGGGAEDYYSTGMDWGATYYCNFNSCDNSYGGNGGANPTGGTGSGSIGKGGAYKFGMGENYTASDNSSSGGGGGGYMGGTSGNNHGLYLRGGTGGGGSSYINNSVISNGKMENGTKLNWVWNYDAQAGYDNGQNARAQIRFTKAQTQKLTINYLDVNNKQKLHDSYVEDVPYGSNYSVKSPNIKGYSVVDPKQATVEGIMPKQDVVIDVYYDYSKITIHYQELGTGVTLAKDYVKAYKTGSQYNVKSPDVEGYSRYEDNQDYITGTKLDHDEEFFVFYVKGFGPIKHIVAVNGRPIPQEASNKGVELKQGDIVTYEIRYKNNRNTTVNETFEEVLNKNVFEYIGNEVGTKPTVKNNPNDTTVTWNVSIPAKTNGSVRFDVKIVDNGDVNSTVDNWNRKDPLVRYEVIKEANPVSGSYVGFGDDIEYSIYVKNTGKKPIHNIVVVDKIPAGTQFLTTNLGEYVANGNYVKFVIDTLEISETKKLTFKVDVTAKVTDDSKVSIKNKALYDNFTEDGNTHIQEVIDKGRETNEVEHFVVGPMIGANKTANPASGSVVNKGQEIAYTVDVTNEGTVDSNYIRIVDKIPTGTTFVEGSLSFVNSNASGNDKYLVSYGNEFDIHYKHTSQTSGYYYINNMKMPNKDVVHFITITWPSGLTWGGSTPGGWTVLSQGSTSIKFDISQNSSKAAMQDFFNNNFRLNGDVLKSGNIKIAYDGPILPKEHVQRGSNFEVAYNIANARYYVRNANFSKIANPVKNVTISWPNGLRLVSDSTPSGWSASTSGNSKTFSISNNNDRASVERYINSLAFEGTYGTKGSISVSVKCFELKGEYNNYINKEFSVSAHGNSSTEDNWYGSKKKGTTTTTLYNGKPIIPDKIDAYFNYSYNNYKDHVSTSCGGGITLVCADGHEEGWGYGPGGGVGRPSSGRYNMGVRKIDEKTKQILKDHGGVVKLDVHAGGGDAHNNQSTHGKIIGFYEYTETELNYDVNGSSQIPNTGYITSLSGNFENVLPTHNNNIGCKYVPSGNYVECVTSDLRAENPATGQTKDHAILSFKVRVDQNTPVKVIKNTALYENVWNDPGLPGTNPVLPKEETNEVYHPLGSKMTISANKSSNPASGERVDAFQTIEYTINVTNNGQIDIPYAVVRDNVPKQTTYVPNSATEGGAYVNGYVEWVLKDLRAGETRPVKFMVEVKPNVDSKESTIINEADYGLYVENPGEAGKTDVTLPNKTNRTEHYTAGDVDHPGVDKYDVALVKGANPVSGTAIKRGDDIEYTIEVTNTGEMLNNVILVKDFIPEGTTFKTLGEYEGGKNSPNLKVSDYVSPAKDFVEYEINYLAAGDSVTLKFTVNVDKETTLIEIQNVAKYFFNSDTEADNIEVGSIPENLYDKNTNVVEHPLLAPNLTAEKVANPESGSVIARGKTIKYTISVTNDSDVLANYVSITDPIPAETTYKSKSIILSNVSDDAEYNREKNQIEVVMYDMQPHETRTITFEVKVNKDARDGDYIYNTGYFEHSFTKPGNPGDGSLPTPKDPTNTTVHTVDITIETLPTGGSGFNYKLMVTVGSVAIVGGLLLAKKRKED